MSVTPTSFTSPLLEMREVTVGSLRNPAGKVIEGVTWSVAPGDFWVVAGLQGSGKSDFLTLAAGLMSPLTGEYQIFGKPAAAFRDAPLREQLRLGLVFDGGQLFHHLTIAENIALPLQYHRNPTEAELEGRLKQILELTELMPWAGYLPGSVSRNWQQRAGLARALMLKPEVLLVDNPLAGLDLRHQSWWLNFLGQLSRGHTLMEGRPVTLVVTTDD
ncbi:MAG TPA: ATP-binding cassette domain-containing protein, partial [Verrucomicrobiae bacterium]|nr:ATP-binding cassette domain-containing protein [Verrucomicrobiae bacterium]